MYDISLHILDIVENSIRSGAKKINVDMIQDKKNKTLEIRIKDNGAGMDEETLKRCIDPFFSTKDNKRIGLGLSLFSQAAEQTGGKFEIKSRKGSGTVVRALFNTEHPDMKPLGNIDETIKILKATHPEIVFSLNKYTVNR